MAKKKLKVKEPIRLRSKMLANGNESLYLDEYDSHTQKHRYEFLHLYLIPEVNELAKIQNSNTMRAAQKIKSQRIIELTNEGAGVKKHATRSKMLLTDWMKHYSQRKLETGQSEESSRQIDKITLHLIKYKGGQITMGEVNRVFCEGFLKYLKGARTRNGEPLAEVTQHTYYKRFSMAMGWAVTKEVIPFNPATQVDRDLRPRVPESKREHLDPPEVVAMIGAPCPSEATKQAYLFSCFCGLRYSDIVTLTWGDVVTRNGKLWIEKVQQKTQKPVSVPIEDAKTWLPERGDAKDTDTVFSLPSLAHINKVIKEWAQAAGVDKHLTFHTARHTFGTLGLTAGADLYTVSRLMGHTNIKTTQIYGKIVDKKKDEALQRISSLFK